MIRFLLAMLLLAPAAALATPTLDEALAACERLGKYMVDITTANKLISKCSRIRAMHDDAQSKRDLDTIDRFLDSH